MQIEMRAAAELSPYANNPRHNDAAVAAVAASIRGYGFKVPIVIDNLGVVIAGHTRLKAALQLGLDEVPCIVADDLTPEQVKAFRIADNKVAELAEWDFEKLIGELDALKEVDFDLDATGFSFAEREIVMDRNGVSTGKAKVMKKRTPPSLSTIHTIRKLIQSGDWEE